MHYLRILVVRVRTSFLTASGLVSLVLALATGLPAAAQVTTADLEGSVIDEDGAGLAATRVTARNQADGTVRTAVSDARGRYRISALKPGTYELAAELEDFVLRARPRIRLELGKVETVPLRLARLSISVSDTIVVTDQTPLVERTESDIGIVVLQDETSRLPLNSRNVIELALLSPGVNAFRNTSPPFSPLNFGAQNNRATVLLIDGIDHSNDLLGGILGTTPGIVPQNATEQFEVITNRFEAEYGTSAAGIVNLITRSGSNALHFDAFAFFRDDELNARGHFESESTPFERTQFGASIGGPVTPDRTHFFAALERNETDNFVVVNTGGAFPEVEGAFLNPDRTSRFLLRLDHGISERQWLEGRISWLDNERDEFFGGNVARSGGAAVTEEVRSGTLGHRRVGSSRFVNELRIGWVDWELATRPFDSGPRLIFPSAELGRWPGGRQTLAAERWQARNDTFYRQTHGAAELNWKFGFEISYLETRQIADIAGTGLLIFPFDRAPQPFLAILGVGEADAGRIQNDRFGLYAQNDWSPTPRWTLNLGVRYDLDTNSANQEFVSTKNDPGLPFIVRNNRDLDDDNISLRTGFAWDVAGNGKTILRGGYGIFYGRIPTTLAFAERSSDAYRFYNVFFPGTTDPDAIDLTGRPFQVDSLLPENLETPYSTQFSLGLSHQLTSSLALDVDLIGSRGYHEILGRSDVNPLDPATFSRPLPQFQEIYVARGDGRSFYDALQIALHRPWSGKFGFRASYTQSEAENDFDDPIFAGLGFGRGPAGWDERHRLVVSGQALLPYGIRLSGIGRWASGRRFTVFTGNDENLNGDLTDDQPPGVGRNSEKTDGFTSVDLRLSREFQIGRWGLELVGEVFNVFNSVNFEPTSYIGNVNSPSFGEPTAALAPRQGQIGVQLSF